VTISPSHENSLEPVALCQKSEGTRSCQAALTRKTQVELTTKYYLELRKTANHFVAQQRQIPVWIWPAPVFLSILITKEHVPDEVYEHARQHFSEDELAKLTLAIVAINGWNRFGIAFRAVPGSYRPVRRHEPAMT
jgi:alkylhydroperoxidase family enzyme